MFGKRLRHMRMKRGYTQPYMAEQLGVALRSYQCYEGGDRYPSFEILVKMGDVLNVPTDFLLGRDDFLQSLGVSVDEYL